MPASLEFYQFPCRSDNYGVLVHAPDTGETASIDAPDAAAVDEALTTQGWKLSHIFTTHHHADHTGGNAELKAKHGATIYGPRGEADKIPGLDQAFGENDSFEFSGHEVRVFETPGHTRGHIMYWLPDSDVAFVGDTLFALGCGRIFEGDFADMYASLEKIKKLPEQTVIYCGHEYTQANAAFSMTVDPTNPALLQRVKLIGALRADGKPTLPTTLDVELETNPFLRPNDPDIRRVLGMENATDLEVFTEIRERKNNS